MKILYTNPLVSQGVQTDPAKSIGGWVSSTPIPNDFFENLFSSITLLSKASKKRETLLIAIQNDSNVDYENISLIFDWEDDLSIDIKTAFVSPSIDECNEFLFEKIANSSSMPFYATFENVEKGVALEIGELLSGKVIGIWISKQLNEKGLKVKTCEEMGQDYEDGIKDEVVDEKITIKLQWDEVSPSPSDSPSGS